MAALQAWRGWVVVSIAVASLVYGGWSAINDTGLGGWLNYWQSGGAGGRYSLKLSGVLATLAVMLPALGIAGLVARLFGTSLDVRAQGAHQRGQAPQPPSPLMTALRTTHGGTSMRTMVIMGLGLIAIGWAAVLGAYAWGQHAESVDRTTQYAPLDLDHPLGESSAASSHLSLRARVLGDHALAFGKQDYNAAMTTTHWIVPIADRGWTVSAPVAWLLQVPPGLGMEDVRRRPGGPWLVKISGPVARHTLEAFKKQGLKFDDGVRLVEWVRAVDASPEQRALPSGMTFNEALALCAGITVIGLAFIGVMALGQRRARVRAQALDAPLHRAA